MSLSTHFVRFMHLRESLRCTFRIVLILIWMVFKGSFAIRTLLTTDSEIGNNLRFTDPVELTVISSLVASSDIPKMS